MFISQTIIVMISSVMVYASIDFIYNYVLKDNTNYEPVTAIGMLVPMGAVMGLVSYFSAKYIYRYITKITYGINSVANGDFSTRLNPQELGPLKEVSINFNKMVEELDSVQILRDDFVNNFSHEFKTPITSINGFAYLLLEDIGTEEEKKEYLQIIIDETQRLASLSENALLLSRLESQQIVVDKKKYYLDEQIKQCAILLSKEWTQKNIDFVAELEEVEYIGNYDLMQQVWLNLLANAIKFTPEYGEIKVTLKKLEDYIQVEVTDTGKGMSEEEVERIFTKYYQVNLAANKGLGLGLSIVHRIVNLCDGKIEVKSKINEGSTFIVHLPYDD